MQVLDNFSYYNSPAALLATCANCEPDLPSLPLICLHLLILPAPVLVLPPLPALPALHTLNFVPALPCTDPWLHRTHHISPNFVLAACPLLLPERWLPRDPRPLPPPPHADKIIQDRGAVCTAACHCYAGSSVCNTQANCSWQGPRRVGDGRQTPGVEIPLNLWGYRQP